MTQRQACKYNPCILRGRSSSPDSPLLREEQSAIQYCMQWRLSAWGGDAAPWYNYTLSIHNQSRYLCHLPRHVKVCSSIFQDKLRLFTLCMSLTGLYLLDTRWYSPSSHRWMDITTCFVNSWHCHHLVCQMQDTSSNTWVHKVCLVKLVLESSANIL